ncbi:MAG: TetR/AcrR family transcriptional regulator [Lachnospiraceae bacterium]|nr:TetR/AcrR family transcriptional regulator [Lachnospiraceae bacterium]
MGESVIRKQQMEQRTRQILNAALELFCEKGIEDTSVEEAAKAAGVGPATIYRYFETKAELAISAGIAYWQKIAEKYVCTLSEEKYIEKNGYCQMHCIFQIFIRIFEEEFKFLKFLQEFDIFVRRYNIPKERLTEYEECILNLKPYVTDALEKGLKDGSLDFPYTVEEVYFSIMHTLLSLMQKLSYNGYILSSDERIELVLQVRITGNLLLKGLAGKNNTENGGTL